MRRPEHSSLSPVPGAVRQLRDVLASILPAKLVVRLEDNLMRVRIRGDWDVSPTSLIGKEPLKDVGEGTVDFPRGVVSSGGRLGKTLYKEFGERFAP
jgi:hypothetical protein